MTIKSATAAIPGRNAIQRRRPAPLALEQRFMFDGAALDFAVDTFDGAAWDNGACAEAPNANLDLFHWAIDNDAVAAAAVQAGQVVRHYLSQASDEQLFALFNGGADSPDDGWSMRLEALRTAIGDGSFSLDIVTMDSVSQFTAIAAYSGDGPNGTPAVFINQNWFAMFDTSDAAGALVEEFGHAMDDYLNPFGDTAGDEGEAFAASVLDRALSADFTRGAETGQVTVDQTVYEVEFASFQFVNSYQMITDLDGDGVVDNNENWAEKEQETHTLLVGNTSINNGGLAAPNEITINDAINSSEFSGNDVSAIGLNIGGQDYYGWISRPVKVQGQVVGFYFWTDQDFTDLSAAQVDGNQDGDTVDAPGDPGVTDNKGFILVVDQSYFTGLINAGLTQVSVAASPVWSALGAGTYDTIEIKSSSDRVDAALNNLLGAGTTPTALTAVNDLASGAPGTSGGAALEEGADNNAGSLNVQTGSGNLTDTINATGNVLTNDVNADGATPLAVIGISSNSSNQSATITSGAAGVVTGRYGTLTLNADGSYSYVIDNSNGAVDALLSASTSLQDVFTYTIDDGNGGTATATLTVEIDGSNDAPVAADDYNTAKESLLTDGSEYTGSDTVGAKATGDVTLNDTDVDHTEAQKTIVGLDETGAATAGAYTASGSNTTLTFATSTNINSVSIGANVFWDHDANAGTAAVALAISDGNPTPTYTFLTVTAKQAGAAAGTTDFTLSGTPTHYWNGSAWTAFTDVEAQLAAGSREFEFGAANGNVAANSAKGGTLEVGGVDVVVSVDVNGISGSVYEGMVVTALDGATSVLPSGTVVTKVNYDGSGNITSVELSNDFSPKPTDPTGYALSFTMPTGGDTTITTAYGTLELLANGTYTYTPIAGNALIGAGETVVESFDYIMQDALGAKSSATLYITLVGSGANDPTGTNDTITAVEAGGVSNGTAGSDPTATNSPNRLIDNDTTPGAFPNTFVSTVTSTQTGNSATPADNSVANNGGTSPAVVVGKYGTFTIGADGSYVYTVDNTNAEVEALRTSGQTLSETFSYVLKNYDAGNTTLGGFDTALVTINIQGANDTPVAINDTVTAIAGQAAPAGNVLNNDTDVDAGDTKTVTHVQAGTTAAPGTAVSGAVAVTGTYGTLTINPDGSYSYAIDTNNAAVKALAAGATTTETFSYQMQDASGAVSVATLTVTVTGANDAPVNAYPASVTGALNTVINFTGANLVSVGDVDTNLQSVTLHVDNGTLTASGSGGTITGAGTSDLVISGTQAEINAILASLSYTPTTGFTGSDFLTIFSQDSANAYDSDGFAINIPTAFTGPTVTEADLGTGSNPSGTGEAANTMLTAPSGQSFGASTQSGSDAYGTWTLTSGGVFTYTLTSAPAISGASTTRTINVLTYDQFGNATSNPVTVTILDDGPTAIADTNSANDGGTAVTGAVLTDGTDDVFGADGAKAGGGVVGVRAAGGDTTTAVTTGTGTAIAGQYGSLTLNANGSYTYTPGSNALVAGANDVFVYTIEDADGSRSTTTLTIGLVAGAAPSADLVIAKTVNLATPERDGQVIYTLVVTNNGASTASNVRVTDELPAGLSFVGASRDGSNWDTDGSVSGFVVNPSGNDICTIGDLANGASATLYIKVAVTSAFAIVNTASVTSDTADPNTANNVDNGGDGNQTVDAWAPITVTGGSYNENSERAIFTVSAEPGRVLTFDVRDVAAPGKAPTGDGEGKANDTLDTAPLYYSLDNGATWHLYTGAPVTAGANGVLIAVDITNERDDVYEGEESFQLVVNPGQASQAVGYASIFDDGTGTVTRAIDPTTTSYTGTDTGGVKDDDRPVTPAPVVEPPKPPAPIAAPQPVAPYLPPAPAPEVRPAPAVIDNPVTRPATAAPLWETGGRETHTSTSGFPVIVVDTGQSNLSIYRGVADQYADSGRTSSFAVPYDAFAHSDPSERIMLSADLADGTALPSWVVFDSQSGVFTVTPPREFTGELRIKVTARDSQGREISTLFRFSVGEEQAAIDLGRPSLSDRLQALTRDTTPSFLALNATGGVRRAS